MSEHPDVAYLKQDQIGLVIAKALSSVYQSRPKNPVDYLGKWLLNHSKAQKLQVQMKEHHKKVKQLRKKHEDKLQKDEKNMKKEQKKLDEKQQQIEKFQKLLQRSDDFDDLLPAFVQHLLNHTCATGVYIAQLEQEKQKITQTSDQDAHSNPEGPKYLRYIQTSKGHEYIKDKKLLPEEGVTYDIFKEKENSGDQDPDAAADAGQGQVNESAQVEENKAEPEAPHVFIKDIVREPRMKFWEVPRLGSYLAVLLNYNNCEFEDSFDKALANHIDCEERRAKQAQEKEAWEEEQKAKLQEGGAPADQSQNLDPAAAPDQTNIADQSSKKFEPIEEDDYDSFVKQYAIALDTSGQDRQLTEEQKQFVLNSVKLFKEKWEESQKDNLKKDIRMKVQLSNDERDYKESDEEKLLTEEEQKAVQDHLAIKEQLGEEQKQQQIEIAKHKWFSEYLSSDAFKKKIDELRLFKVIKYRKIWQSLFYLLKYERQAICYEDTNKLEWKKAKELVNKEFFEKLKNYQPFGPKEDEYLEYQKLGWIQKNIPVFEETQNALPLQLYSVALFKLHNWLRNTISFRRNDYEMRLKQKAEEREARQELIKTQGEQHATKKQEALENAKTEFEAVQEQVEGDKEPFNEEEFTEKWDGQNLAPEEPPVIEDFIDNDIEKQQISEES